MHNLFLLGSPRKNGNSETMAKAVANGLLKQANSTVEYIHLNSLSIRPCQACGGCNTSGQCIINDDMTVLYEKTDAADRLFFVSPVYFYGLTAQTKAYVDRCQAKWARRYLLNQKYRNSEQRTGHLLSCAATNGDKLFEGSVLAIQCLCDTLNIGYGEAMLLRNMESRTALQDSPEDLAACYNFGVNVTTNQQQI